MVGRTRTAQAVVAVAGPIDLIAARREEIDKLLRRFGVILDDKNPASPSCHDVASPNLRGQSIM